MLKKFIFLLMLAQSLGGIFAQTSTDPLQIDDWIYRPNYPIDSVAAADDITSLYFNPAGLGFHPFQGAYFFGQNSNQTISNHSLFLNLLGFAFSTQYRTGIENASATRISIGSSLFHSDAFSLGTSYSWVNSNRAEIDQFSQLDIGLILRPHRRLSIGLVGRGLNKPQFVSESLKPRYDLGISLRPLPTNIENLTLSVDTSWTRINNIEELNPRFLAEYQSILGFTAYGGYETNGNAFAGMKFSQEITQIIGQSTYDNGGFNSLSAGILFSRERFISQSAVLRRFLIIDMDIAFDEIKSSGSLFTAENTTHSEILDSIYRARQDSRIVGIILRGSRYNGGWAQAEELRNELENFAQKKPIFAYLESASSKEYYIASAAKRISMPVSASIDIAGFKLETYFIKDLLQKIGIEADFIAIGKYKSAPELFNRSEISPENREQLEAILSSLDKHFTKKILTARSDINEQKLEELRNTGFYTAQKAKDSLLIDRVEYEDEFLKAIQADGYPNAKNWKYNLREYLQIKDYKDFWSSPDTIAVLHLSGDIVTGESSRAGFFSRNSIGSKTTMALLQKLQADNSIKAVVIRVNSPGGSALASDLIWSSVKELSKKKKVYISMGNSAASGGYYIATGADKIFANNATITGSIGIFSGKFSIKSLYETLGVNKTVLKTHPNAAIFSESSKFTAAERELLTQNISEFYELFLKRVAENRKFSRDEANDVAQGRVYSGSDALKVNLADEIGGLRTAIQAAIVSENINPSFLRVRHYPQGQNDFLALSQGSLVTIPSFAREMFKQLNRSEELKDERIYFLMPYQLEIH